nr:hypothetical protein [Sphingomonadales bacterium]
MNSKNNQKFNRQELRDKIKNKSDALREWGTPQKIDTVGNNESWYYDFYALGSTPSTEAGALKGNSALSNKYIQIYFEGDEVAYLRLNGISDSFKQNSFEARILRARGIAADIYVVSVLVAAIYFLSRGGVN